MASMLCRLCLDSDNVVDIFHPDLTNSERLRSCILLATGINISRDDVVTKHVCASCCDISVKLYKFRKNALANDRALKIQLKQSCLEAPAKVEDIVTTNKTIVAELSNRSNVSSPTPTDSYVVHPSVRRLYKTHQNLIIPKQLLRVDLDPKLLIVSLDENEIPTHQIVNDAKDPLDVFKASRPEINVNIIKAPLSNKRPMVDDEEGVAKRPKIDDVQTNKIDVVQTNKVDVVLTNQIGDIPTNKIDDLQTNLNVDVQINKIDHAPVVVEEGPDCLKDTQNLIGEPRTKPHTKVSYKIIETETGKENLDGGNKIVLARVTTKEPDEPAYTPESDGSSSTSSIYPASLPRKLLRPRKSRPSFFLSDYEQDTDDEDFLLERLEEEDAYNCELCSKTFNQASKLKMHMRCHKNCHVCKAVFRSAEALSYHQTNVCFKMVIAYQPNICLTRCDDIAEIQAIKSNMPNIQLSFEERKEDDVMLISDDEEYDTVVGLQPSEAGYIRALFIKYKSMRTPGSKLPANQVDKHIGTDSLSDATIKLNKSQIIVEGMYGSLQSLRVPIKLNVQQELGAHLELKQQERGVTISETWSGKPKQLVKKPVVLNGLSSIPLPTLVPKNYTYPRPSAPNQQVFITLNGPNQPAQLQAASHNLPQMVPQTPMQFVSNQGYFQQVQFVPQPSHYVTPQTIATPQPPTVDRLMHITQKPDSNQPQPSSSFLRVKAPWELNKL